jgi:thiamine biosynthesis lipoprotein
VIPAVAELPGIRRVEEIMGMPIIVDVRDEIDEARIDEVFEWFRWVDATFSTYKADSEISRLNRDELALRECHEDVRRVIARCRELRDETDGYFDADGVVDGEIDPSGLVKGWSVDRAAALLDEVGIANYALNAGGDMRLRGDALPKRRWRVGIQHPLIRDRIAAVLETDDLAVATSGAYVRGDHVVDPHTGRPPEGVLSVTVAGPELATADAFATAAFAMGPDGPEWTRGLRPYEAMTITADEKVLSTAGFPRVREPVVPDLG